MMGLLTGYSHLQGQLFKLGLASNTWYVRLKQASEMVLCVLCDCKAPAVLRLRHLGHNFFTSGDFTHRHLGHQGERTFSNCGAAECLCKGLQKESETFELQASLWYPPWCTQLYTFMLNVPSHFIN